jgi:hypothetical protein
VARERSWTDDDLRTAIAASRSWTQVRDRLGLSGGGSVTAALRRRAEELGLDVAHLPAPGETPRRWSDADLVAAVAGARSLHGVFKQLGLSVGGNSWRRMQEHIVRLGLDTSHWTEGLVRPGTPRPAPRRFSDAELAGALDGARSLAEVIRRLGLEPTNGSSYRRVKRRIDDLGLSTAHLAGQAWSRGTSPRRARLGFDELFVRGSTYRSGAYLKKRLLEAGLVARRCAVCGLERWRGERAPLHLDHVNGDPMDNRLENLRLLCPNCHAQTETYCGRNIGGGYSPGSG